MKHSVRLPRRILAVAIAVILALLAISGITLAVKVSIDDFSSTDQLTAVVTGAPAIKSACDSQSGVASALGGTRELTVTKKNGTGGGDEASIKADTTNDWVNVANSVGISNEAEVIWDGVSNGCALDSSGLGGVDLTGGGTENGFVVRVAGNDLSGVTMTIRVYTGTNWSNQTVMIPAVSSGNVDFVFPFSGFVTRGGTGAVFTSTGAVVLMINNEKAAGSDTAVRFVKTSSSAYDYGDLPDTGGITATNNYAGIVSGTLAGRHMLGTGLRLGASVDAEENGQPGTSVNGDDLTDVDDEDGVIKTPSWTWTAGTRTGRLDITVNGKSGACNSTYSCFVNGWIDWNNDGTFNDSTEYILRGSVFRTSAYGGATDSMGSMTFYFNIPAGTNLSNAIYYARFRLCGGADALGVDDCSTPGGTSAIGEVEDYKIYFGTLSVNLASFTAVSAGGHNALAWETTSELNNLGFNVWRGVSASAPDVKLNPYVIPSQAPGGTDGFAYTYNDFDITGGVTYYYWLEDVDLKGTVTRHGPVQVIAGNAPTAVTVTALQASSSTSALPFVALGLTLLVGVGIVVGRRRH